MSEYPDQLPEHGVDSSSLIQFPVEFPIKIMGKNTVEFRAFVLEVANKYICDDKLLRIDEKESSNGKYLSCTIVAIFDGQSDIDAVYQALTASPLVVMAL